MKLVKCPRCDLNYIREDEKYCKVCLREMKGEPTNDDMELCSVCNAAPALPGTMDEIIPEIEEDIPANEYGDIQNELSLESVIEDENEDDDEDKDDDDR